MAAVSDGSIVTAVRWRLERGSTQQRSQGGRCCHSQVTGEGASICSCVSAGGENGGILTVL